MSKTRKWLHRTAATAAVVVVVGLPGAALAQSDYVGEQPVVEAADYTAVLPTSGSNTTRMALMGFGTLALGIATVLASRNTLVRNDE